MTDDKYPVHLAALADGQCEASIPDLQLSAVAPTPQEAVDAVLQMFLKRLQQDREAKPQSNTVTASFKRS